jgi:hypothetical protein
VILDKDEYALLKEIQLRVACDRLKAETERLTVKINTYRWNIEQLRKINATLEAANAMLRKIANRYEVREAARAEGRNY